MIRVCCPDVRNLAALLGEDGSEHEADDLVRHLETCVDCQKTLESLAAEPTVWEDTAVGLGSSGRAERTLHCLIERLKQADSPPTNDLSFLRPARKPGLLGMLGPYEVLEEIGRGGMGVVLKAHDATLDRVVAIKVLSPFLASSADARRRFKREVQAAAAVCHENVVAVHGVDEADGLPYLVMQYIDGESLQTRIDRTGPLGVDEIVRIGMQTATGLAVAHAHGLIHRDIKPANLLLMILRDCTSEFSPHVAVKITDFGLARMADDVGLTRDGIVAGTPEYMRRSKHGAKRWTTGPTCLAWAVCSTPCASALRRFGAPTRWRSFAQVSDEEPASIRSLNPSVPIWLEGLISRLMAKDPERRFQSATEVVALLEERLSPLRQPNVVPAPEQPSPYESGSSAATKQAWYARAMEPICADSSLPCSPSWRPLAEQ